MTDNTLVLFFPRDKATILPDKVAIDTGMSAEDFVFAIMNYAANYQPEGQAMAVVKKGDA